MAVFMTWIADFAGWIGRGGQYRHFPWGMQIWH